MAGWNPFQNPDPVHLLTVPSLNPGTWRLLDETAGYRGKMSITWEKTRQAAAAQYFPPKVIRENREWLWALLQLGTMKSSEGVKAVVSRCYSIFMYNPVQYGENPLLTCRDWTQGYHCWGYGSDGSVILLFLIGIRIFTIYQRFKGISGKRFISW
jgi:hypothetical protein